MALHDKCMLIDLTLRSLTTATTDQTITSFLHY